MERALIVKALDDAFTAHVSLLFAVLCVNGSDQGAIEHFMKGFDIALKAHAEAMKRYAAQN